ncbi:hypothetical protein DEJ50_32225 [Streptomyces venezuelae]|uniref:Uncharacterized protein n=1 Tax=Streptomyces venezuelae TaxID=54571 RepID=A0A5P2DC87_STRVZ|nr:hypothetical protein DEJ50_32225 [Streptomyces venezuelae]
MRLVRLAFAVSDTLRHVGMPAVYAGSSYDGLSTGVSGAVVFHAPYTDASAGVYVHWMPSPALLQQVTRPEGPDPQAVALGSAAQQAMHTAIRGILTAGGWQVTDHFNSAAGEDYLKVTTAPAA